MSRHHVPLRNVILLVVLALQAAACGRIRAELKASPKEVFTKSIEELEATGDFDTHARTAPAPASIAFFQRLDEIDRWLADHPSARAAAASRESEASRREFAPRIGELEPFFRDIGELLSTPETLSAINEGRTLAQRPSVHLDDRVNDSGAMPDIERSTLWVDLLCARAIAFAGDAETAGEAVHALAQALDLIRLLDDGSLNALHNTHKLGTTVLETLQLILPTPTLHPRHLRSQLEPRLSFAMRGGRLAQTLRRESAHRMVAAKNLAQHSRQKRLRGQDDESEELPPQVTERLRTFKLALSLLNLSGGMGRGSETCNLAGGPRVPPKVIEILESTHDFDMACAMARTALAVHESRWLTGKWPTSLGELGDYTYSRPTLPCLQRTFDYERSFSKVRVTASSRRGKFAVDEPLHEWVWDREGIMEMHSTDL